MCLDTHVKRFFIRCLKCRESFPNVSRVCDGGEFQNLTLFGELEFNLAPKCNSYLDVGSRRLTAASYTAPSCLSEIELRRLGGFQTQKHARSFLYPFVCIFRNPPTHGIQPNFFDSGSSAMLAGNGSGRATARYKFDPGMIKPRKSMMQMIKSPIK